MSIRIVDGLHLGGLIERVDAVTPEALLDAAEHVKEISAKKAPLLTGAALHKANDERRADPGALRRSAYAKIVDDSTAAVGFTEFYATWQHERLDYHHEDGEAKFLELPLASEGDNVLRIIADRVSEAL
jgi:hypothetical protein